MKTTLLALSLLLSLTVSFVQAASELTGCAAKKADIEQQLKYANQHNNMARVAGLEKALREVESHCTDSSLLKQRQEKVAAKKEDVQKREQELAQAQIEGRASKIEKRQQKLAEAREELQEAEHALTQ